MGIFNKGRMNRHDAISEKGSKPSNVAGLYYIRDKDKQVQYVGLTNDLKRREKEHIKSGKINKERPFFDFHIPKSGTTYDDLRYEEKRKIAKYNPPLNKTSGREGRPTNNLHLSEDYGSAPKGSRIKKFFRFMLKLIIGAIIVLCILSYFADKFTNLIQ